MPKLNLPYKILIGYFICSLLCCLSCTKLQVDISAFNKNIYEKVSIGNEDYLFFNPYKNKGLLHLKGSLHNHTDNSILVDGYGSGAPSYIARKLRDEGKYDFYTFTDHNYITDDPRIDGIIWLGNSIEDTRNEQHLCVYNLPDNYKYKNFYGDFQAIVDHYHNLNSVVSYAHPDWDLQYQGNDKIANVANIAFVEVLNPGNGGSERAFAIMQDDFSCVFGVGVDDYHYSTSDESFNKACVFVYANEKTRESIWCALLSGCFYASKGAHMDIACKDLVITIKVDVDSNIDLCVPSKEETERYEVIDTFTNCKEVVYKIDGRFPIFWFRIRNNDGVAISQAFKLCRI